MSLTIKGNGRHEDTWIVVPDGPVAEQVAYIVELFGLDREKLEGRTPYEILMEADEIHKATISARSGLGARPTSDWPNTRGGGQRRQAAPAADQEPDEVAHEFQDVLDAIESAESKQDLAKVFVNNKPAFQNADVQAAAKAKGEQLKGEAA